jgi:phage/plasmid-like protein (TIGR03299 family)
MADCKLYDIQKKSIAHQPRPFGHPKPERTLAMAHNIDMTNGRANIAFMGSRKDIWHRLGQEMKPYMSVQDWAKAAGLNWTAIKVPAIANLQGEAFDHIVPEKRFPPVENQNFLARSDSGGILGACTDTYQQVQPIALLEWFKRYIEVDDRFALDVAGSLKEGRIIWATATFRDKIDVGASAHVARILMSTTFDCTGATINKGTMTRVVCNNTLSAALSDKRCEVRTRHNTKFDAAKVGKELAELAKGFDQFKAIGDAMALNEMSGIETSQFFKAILDIPFEAPKADVSTRKLNQFDELRGAYAKTVQEGTEANKTWTALNAVTRYVDHQRSTRGDDDETAARFGSAQFGSGATLKAKAWDLLMPRIKDKVPVAA